MKAKANDLRVTFNKERYPIIELTLTERNEHQMSQIDELRRLIDEGKLLSVEVKQHRKKRSLNANAYCWALINEMANVLRSSKDEVYIKMLKRYGQSSVVSIVDEAVEVFMKSVKYAEEIGDGKVDGKDFTHIKVFMGSSNYDSRQMSILIDGIVSECKELGIETMTPHEIARLKEGWRA